MREFARLQKTWDALGEQDPLWAVLSTPESRSNRWDIEEFFATGEREVDHLFDRLRGLDLPVQLGRALDFGCGVGRITQALGRQFERTDGVDIATSMIDHAIEWNRQGQRCQFHVNTAIDLRIFGTGSFDFVYSRITLMHVPPKLTKRYLIEFARVLKPGGLAVFHVPSSMPPIRRLVYELAMLKRRAQRFSHSAAQHWTDTSPKSTAAGRSSYPSLPSSHKHEMYFIRRTAVRNLIERHGLSLIATEETDTDDVHDVLYYAVKQG